MPRVRSVLEGAEAKRHTVYLSLINLGEVLYITERERGLVATRRALGAVEQLPLEIVGVSRATVLAAAHIKARFPISYAVFCLKKKKDKKERGDIKSNISTNRNNLITGGARSH